ncbi:hypothetical protein BOX15_Mlig020444g1 [Macrostomum lignano]|uniref:G-protein coupled receptors family 3 profile domain-containing protein n=1 Tax=Macrostomum lignano TaxID=282301 RepID=A0A267ER50_9PLAT|nr:hypothetical protein BOX15_Mlig020444g1 [Macrostomum lignano]
MEGSIEMDTAVMNPALVETRIGPAGKTLPELYRQFLIEYPARLADARMKTIRGFDLRFDSVMSAALALNQTLQSWNYSDEMQLGNSSFKAELMKNILKLDFIGLSGRVVFDSNGDRTSVVMIYQLRNLTRHLVGLYDPIANAANWTHANLWFAGGSPPVDAPELLTRQLQLSEAGTIALTSASSIGIAVSIATVAVNFHYRELRLIKMSSPLVNNVIGAGCLMCYASCIVMAVNSHWAVSTGLCWTQTALLTIGYSAAFGAMLAKTWRVHRIFTNVKLRRVTIKDSHLFAVILLVLATDVALLVTWAIFDPMTVQRFFLPAVETEAGTLLKTVIDECTCNNMTIWIGVELGIKGLLLLFALFFAWETRTVQVEALNDSKKIGVCVYNTTVMGLIGVVILFALPSSSQDLKVSLIASCIIICSSTTLILVFGSKIFMLIKRGPARVGDNESAMRNPGGIVVPLS